MPWTLVRLTTNLTADADWRGLERSSASAPASNRASDSGATIFVPCGGGPGTALVNAEGKIAVKVGWCSSASIPVSGVGTSITIEPVTIDALAMPTNSGQLLEVLSVGEPREHAAATPVPWTPLFLYVGHAALATVRLSNMVNAGAARVAVWVWTR